jgi:serine/threonine protein kinase
LTANQTVKISDFGMSRQHQTIYQKALNQEDVIPVFWMAPETLESTGQYSEKSDV